MRYAHNSLMGPVQAVLMCLLLAVVSCGPRDDASLLGRSVDADTSRIGAMRGAAVAMQDAQPDSAIALCGMVLASVDSMRPQSAPCGVRRWLYDQRMGAQLLQLVCLNNTGAYQQAVVCADDGLATIAALEADTCADVSGYRVRFLNSKSIALRHTGRTVEALEALQQVVEWAKAHNDLAMEAMGCTNMAINYQTLGDTAIAVDYLQRALELHRESGNQRGIAASLITLGNIYNMACNGPMARSYYSEALEAVAPLNLKSTEAAIHQNMGVLALREAHYDEAQARYFEALRLYNQLGNINGMMANWGNMADLCNKQHRHAEAIVYARRQLSASEEAGNINNQRYAHKYLYDSYKHLGNSQLALYHHERFVDMRDSMASVEKQNEMAKLEATFQNRQKTAEIEHLTAMQEAERGRNRLLTGLAIALGAALLVLGVVGLLVLRLIRLRHRQQSIELENRVLRSQMNPHFVFNALSTVNNLILKGDAQTASGGTLALARLMRLILEASRAELITVGQEVEILNHYCQLQALRFPNKFEFEVELEPSTLADELLLPPMIIQPFVENAIVHAFPSPEAHGSIVVRFEAREGELLCSITDNGTGWRDDSQSSHKSLALEITRDRLKLMRQKYRSASTMRIDSPPPGAVQGTKVSISLPIIADE